MKSDTDSDESIQMIIDETSKSQQSTPKSRRTATPNTSPTSRKRKEDKASEKASVSKGKKKLKADDKGADDEEKPSGPKKAA
jgi:hypothetical protein